MVYQGESGDREGSKLGRLTGLENEVIQVLSCGLLEASIPEYLPEKIKVGGAANCR